jgi:DeoR family transcriptional regulator, copper-sensing transcriptional repressor
MPVLTERQTQLLEWLQMRHSALIEEIEAQFGISSATAYRDAKTLVEAGLAVKTNGGIKLFPPSGKPGQTGKCDFCGAMVDERTIFIIQMGDGSRQQACCPHCGLLALMRPGAVSALASEFLYGRMINARQATYLVQSSISPCCEPSVLCFANEDEARRFQLGFGGTLCNLDEARTRISSIMNLDADKH